mmetsp:Transcript_18452/g.35104  ORF Transcript_18452/g.35104 Transcript_18452/m.35104 type:complete len:257 (-) Transcript_18452:1960-2730(-)
MDRHMSMLNNKWNQFVHDRFLDRLGFVRELNVNLLVELMDGHQTFLAHRPLAQQIFHVLTHSLHQNLEVPCFCVPHFLVQILVMLDCLCQLLVRDPSVAVSIQVSMETLQLPIRDVGNNVPNKSQQLGDAQLVSTRLVHLEKHLCDPPTLRLAMLLDSRKNIVNIAVNVFQHFFELIFVELYARNELFVSSHCCLRLLFAEEIFPRSIILLDVHRRVASLFDFACRRLLLRFGGFLLRLHEFLLFPGCPHRRLHRL